MQVLRLKKNIDAIDVYFSSLNYYLIKISNIHTTFNNYKVSNFLKNRILRRKNYA